MVCGHFVIEVITDFVASIQNFFGLVGIGAFIAAAQVFVGNSVAIGISAIQIAVSSGDEGFNFFAVGYELIHAGCGAINEIRSDRSDRSFAAILSKCS